jgi:hypothetical protein
MGVIKLKKQVLLAEAAPATKQKPLKIYLKGKVLPLTAEVILAEKSSPSGSYLAEDGLVLSSAPIDPAVASASFQTSNFPALVHQASPAIAIEKEELWLTRKEVAAFLKSHGFPITVNRLAKYGVTGGGRNYYHWCGRALYDRDTALTWARWCLQLCAPVIPEADEPTDA